MRGENANKTYHVYKAMAVLHICNRMFGIPSPGKSNIDAYQSLSSICQNKTYPLDKTYSLQFYLK